MGLLVDILLTLVCVTGLAFLAWWLFGRLLRPVPKQESWVLIPGRGEGETLEQTVRSFIWLRGLGLMRAPIVIADLDLTPEGWELALRLAGRWPGVVVWPAEYLADCIKKTEC